MFCDANSHYQPHRLYQYHLPLLLLFGLKSGLSFLAQLFIAGNIQHAVLSHWAMADIFVYMYIHAKNQFTSINIYHFSIILLLCCFVSDLLHTTAHVWYIYFAMNGGMGQWWVPLNLLGIYTYYHTTNTHIIMHIVCCWYKCRCDKNPIFNFVMYCMQIETNWSEFCVRLTHSHGELDWISLYYIIICMWMAAQILNKIMWW